MGSVFLKGVFSLAALAGAAAAGVGISHVYSGSSIPHNFKLVSSRLEKREDKRILSLDDTETDKREWKKKFTQLKADLEKNKKELGVPDIQENDEEGGIRVIKKRCSEIKGLNSRAFVKWCMIRRDKVVSAQA